MNTITATSTGTVQAPNDAVWDLLEEWKQREEVPVGAAWSTWEPGSEATIEISRIRAIPIQWCGFSISTTARDAGTDLMVQATALPTRLGRVAQLPLKMFGGYLVRSGARQLVRDLEAGARQRQLSAG